MKMQLSKQDGVILLESLAAILVFSLGILALVALLGASVRDAASAGYRSQASLLASQVIGQMWSGDKSNAALVAGYTGSGARYTAWQTQVVNALPGVDVASAATKPVITVDGSNNIEVTVYWKTPGETKTHKYVATARISS